MCRSVLKSTGFVRENPAFFLLMFRSQSSNIFSIQNSFLGCPCQSPLYLYLTFSFRTPLHPLRSNIRDADSNPPGRAHSLYSRCSACLPRCCNKTSTFNHPSFRRRRTQVHCFWQCLCLVRGLHSCHPAHILTLPREERGANTEPTGLGMERWYI